MHGAAVEAHARRQRAGMGVEAGKGGQQRGVDVDQRSRQRSTNAGVSSRMKPARQTNSVPAARSAAVERGVEGGAAPGYAR